MNQTQASRTEYMGQDPGTDNNVAATPAAGANVDLRRVTFGGDTFSNPCFWILLGIVGTIAVQYFMKEARKT